MHRLSYVRMPGQLFLKYLFYCTIVVTCCSCRSDLKSKFNLEKSAEYLFDVGFLSNHKFMGVISSELAPTGDTNRVLFYFGDPITQKKIKFFNADNNLVYTTPLLLVHDTLDGIRHFEIFAKDSILVFGAHNDKLAIVNFSGEILGVLHFESRIKPYLDWWLDYYPTYSGSCVDKNDLFLYVQFYSLSKKIPTNPPTTFFADALNAPFFLRIRNFADSIKMEYTFGLFNFYRRFMNDSMAMTELVRYNVENNQLILFSLFSDTLYFINEDSLTIDHAFRIESSFTSVSSPPVRLTSTQAYQDYLKNVLRYKGYISKVMFDDKHSIYVILVAHTFNPEKNRTRDYSLCLYNSNGEKIQDLSWPEAEGEAGIIYQYGSNYYILNVENNDLKNQGYKVKYEQYKLVYQ